MSRLLLGAHTPPAGARNVFSARGTINMAVLPDPGGGTGVDPGSGFLDLETVENRLRSCVARVGDSEQTGDEIGRPGERFERPVEDGGGFN